MSEENLDYLHDQGAYKKPRSAIGRLKARSIGKIYPMLH